MKMARVPIGMLETDPAFGEIDLPRDARVHHPLQRAIDGGAADPRGLRLPLGPRGILASNQIEQIIGGERALLAEEHVDDQIALA
jgi:hypothetical protein